MPYSPYDEMSLSDVREHLRRQVQKAFLPPRQGRIVGYVDLASADYRRTLLEMLDCVEAEFVWQFPDDRFVEYEAHDEWWARRLGFGREVQRRRQSS